MTFVYQAKVLSVVNESEDYDGITNLQQESTFDIEIEALNCTNDEFAKHFFNVHGIGHLENGHTLVLYFNILDVAPTDTLSIPSDLSFNAMIEKRISEAKESLNQVALKFLSDNELKFEDNEECPEERDCLDIEL